MPEALEQDTHSAHAPGPENTVPAKTPVKIDKDGWMHQRSSVSRLCVHFTWCTKYREKILTNRMAVVLRKTIRTVAQELGLVVAAFETESDHVHLVLWYPPGVLLSKIMQRIKGASAHGIRRRTKWARLTRFSGSKHVWAPSFSASSCEGASLKRLKRYVAHQAPRMSEPEILEEGRRRKAKKWGACPRQPLRPCVVFRGASRMTGAGTLGFLASCA